MHKTLPIALILAVSGLACGDQTTPKPDTTATAAATLAATATATATSAPAETAVAAVTADASAAPSATAVASAAPTGDTKTPAKPGTTAVAAGTATPDESNKGEEKKGASFSAYMSGAKSYKAGQAGTVTAVVNALGDYHINQEYPYKVALNDVAGVSFPEKTVKNVSRGEKRATISIPFTPDKAGTATITGTCSLSVCTKENCVIEKVPLSVSVKVE